MVNKKRVMKNMSNKLFYTLIVFGAIILMGAGVFAAVTAGSTPSPGHSIDSVGAPSGCVSGEYLKYYTTQGGEGYWSCETPFSGVSACSSCDTTFVNSGSDFDTELLAAIRMTTETFNSGYSYRNVLCHGTHPYAIMGGCTCPNGGNVQESRKMGAYYWRCECSTSASADGQGEAFAICAKKDITKAVGIGTN
jgi:hypothetical protein